MPTQQGSAEVLWRCCRTQRKHVPAQRLHLAHPLTWIAAPRPLGRPVSYTHLRAHETRRHL
eukprot:8475174-Prorocentrum_lima.AAC.1